MRLPGCGDDSRLRGLLRDDRDARWLRCRQSPWLRHVSLLRLAIARPAPRARRPRGARRLLGGWNEDPLWSYVYPWLVGNERVGWTAWRLGTGSDLSLLRDAAAEIGQLPAGFRVLDVPTGSGVALQGLRPGQGLDYVAADISATMLDRAMATARSRGVDDQVTHAVADVGALPFDDASFDLVVTFTGLHCFPDPRLAVQEMVRVLRPGGAITGSSLFTDAGARWEPLRRIGTRAGVLGPMCTTPEAVEWLEESGCTDVELALHGALGYFRATREDLS